MTDFPPPLDSRIVSLVLFGSHGRGDADSRSDVDLCIVADVSSHAEHENVVDVARAQYNGPHVDITAFSCDRVRRMTEQGAILLWHFKLEGKVLFDRDLFLRDQLNKLAPVTEYGAKLAQYERVYADLCGDQLPTAFNHADSHALFMIARNTCMLLSMSRQRPAFGRSAVFQMAKTLCPELPLDSHTFAILSEASRTYMHGGPLSALPTCDQYEQVGHLLGFARQEFDARELSNPHR